MTESVDALSILFENDTTINAFPDGQDGDSDGEDTEDPEPPVGGG